MIIGASPGFIFAHFGDKARYEDFIWCINEAAKIGLKTLELETYNEEQKAVFASQEQVATIRQLFKDHGLQSPLFFAEHLKAKVLSLDRKVREGAFDDLKKTIELCKNLEIVDTVGLSSGLPPEFISKRHNTYIGAPPSSISIPAHISWDEVWKGFVDTISRCNESAKDAGLPFLIEPLPYPVLYNAEGLKRLAEGRGSDNLGCVLDVSHTYFQREDIPLAIEKLGDRLMGIHINDTDGKETYHWQPGKGNVDWHSVLKALKKIGYERSLDLEIFGKGVENVEAAYREGKEYLENILTRLEKRGRD